MSKPRYQIGCHSGIEAEIIDNKTKFIDRRALSPKERKAVRKDLDQMLSTKSKRHNVHHIWHDFQSKFIKGYDFKWTGHELRCRVAKWAEKYPAVQIVACDDAVHAGSDLVIIPHISQCKKEWFGVSVVFIPQCTGEPPTKFFLYDGHRSDLLKALKSIKPKIKPRKKHERLRLVKGEIVYVPHPDGLDD